MRELSDMNVVVLIAPKDFRDEEFAQPHAALTLAKANVTVASVEEGKCYGKLGSIVHARMSLADAVEKDWDAVMFVGGNGCSVFVDDPLAQQLAMKTAEAGGVVSAICMAPMILSHAGLLKGVEATVFESYEDDLREHGAIVTGDVVTESKNTINGAPIITGNGPAAAFAFGQALVNSLRAPLDPWQ